MVGFRSHKLKWTKQPDGRWVGTCSCGKWYGLGKTKSYVTNRWNKAHINPLDNWK